MATFLDGRHVLNRDRKKILISEARDQGAILGFKGPTRYLSNFAKSTVTMYTVEFPRVEHAFQAAKMDPNDLLRSKDQYLKELREFAQIPTPGRAKRAGRKLRLRDGWDDIKFDVMLRLVRRKFENHKLLAQKLIDTGRVPIYELNDHWDTTFGVIDEDGYLVGCNWLGEILMLVRSELQATQG
jgi:ribA/ribD-fused uncharacterized protein